MKAGGSEALQSGLEASLLDLGKMGGESASRVSSKDMHWHIPKPTGMSITHTASLGSQAVATLSRGLSLCCLSAHLLQSVTRCSLCRDLQGLSWPPHTKVPLGKGHWPWERQPGWANRATQVQKRGAGYE